MKSLDINSILIAIIFIVVCLFVWVGFRCMKDESIEQFEQFTDDNSVD